MKNHLIISLLILSVGFSQKLTEVVETYENGNIKSITYHKKSRTGIEKVKYEQYYEYGQKKIEETWKDGWEDGLWTWWYENGQKQYEGTYKDDEGISSKCWDEEGNECECGENWREGCD